MGGVAMAYMAAIGIVSFRWFHDADQPPTPIALGGTTVVFAGLGALAHANAKFAGTAAWAFVLGAVFAPGAMKNVQGVQLVYGDPSSTFLAGGGTSTTGSGSRTSPSQLSAQAQQTQQKARQYNQ